MSTDLTTTPQRAHAVRLSTFITGLLLGNIVRLFEGPRREQSAAAQAWLAPEDLGAQSFTLRLCADESSYRVRVLVTPADEEEEEETGDAELAVGEPDAPLADDPADTTAVEAPPTAEELTAEELDAVLRESARAALAAAPLTLSDLPRAAFPFEGADGQWVALTAATATDLEFHWWVHHLLPKLTRPQTEFWPPERRLAVCAHLWRNKQLVLLPRGAKPIIQQQPGALPQQRPPLPNTDDTNLPTQQGVNV